MSPENDKIERSNKSENPIEIMCKKCEEYGLAYEMLTRGHSGEEYGYSEEVKKLKPEIIKLTADNLVKAKPTEREEILEKAIDSMHKGTKGSASTDYIITFFVRDTLLQVLDIVDFNKEK